MVRVIYCPIDLFGLGARKPRGYQSSQVPWLRNREFDSSDEHQKIHLWCFSQVHRRNGGGIGAVGKTPAAGQVGAPLSCLHGPPGIMFKRVETIVNTQVIIWYILTL